MSRYYYPGARDTVESAKKIDLVWLKKQAFLHEACDGSFGRGINWSMNGVRTGNITIYTSLKEGDSYIRLFYKVRPSGGSEESWKDMDYRFPLERVRCHFGGFRWFLRCELRRNSVYCGNRVRILYQIGDYFGCRHCADLSYDSCNESKRYRYGPFSILTTEVKAEEYLEKLKRFTYAGKPTRKYRRYLKLSRGLTDEDKINALKHLVNALK